MRCANPPTICRRSSSISINQSSSTGNLSTRARNPLTNSGVYVEPPPITATLSILLFNACNDNTLYEEALSNGEQDKRQDERHQCARLNQLWSLAVNSIKSGKRNRDRPVLAGG